MRSMTGYGQNLANKEGIKAFIQIKTLNHRFLQVSVICPENLPWEWERKIENKVKREIYRGKVLINLQINRKGSESVEVEPDVELAASYLNALKKLQKNLNLKENIKLSHLLSLSETLKIKERGWEKLEKILQPAIDQVLKQVVESREEEGEKHLKEILKWIKKIESSMSYIEKEFPTTQEKYREKVKDEMEKIASQEDSSLSSNQITSKLGLIIAKGDITEEITRFNSHLDQFNQTLRQKGSVGKKLGFILQELQREINTIGAKSLSCNISHQVVQIKDNIEKIREQIYNIE